MTSKEKNPVNAAVLSKKYKCDVNRLIRNWKTGRTDFEIASSLGIDILTIMQVRREIASIFERERQRTKKSHFTISTITNPRYP